MIKFLQYLRWWLSNCGILYSVIVLILCFVDNGIDSNFIGICMLIGVGALAYFLTGVYFVKNDISDIVIKD